MNKTIYFILIFAGLLILSGCEGINVGDLSDEDLERIEQQLIVCEEPYIRHGMDCCLDTTGTGICDKDENALDIDEQKKDSKDDDTQENIEIDIQGARTLGDDNAPVTMIKFSDFRCPFCQKFDLETWEDLKETYVDTGVVQFVYIDFPVVGGEDAANAAWCAEEQGEFWDFKDGLFELGPQGITDNSMSSLAGDLGMDVDQYNQCYSSQEYSDRVSAEMQEGQQNGLTGTPSFVINGELLVGAQPFSEFQEKIDQHLEEKKEIDIEIPVIIERLESEKLFLSNAGNENIQINDISIEEKSNCGSGTLEPGIETWNLGASCYQTSGETANVVVVTDSGVFSSTLIVR